MKGIRILRAIGVAIALVAIATLSACATGAAKSGPPLTTHEHVDLSRYMGRWYVIANVPYFGERDNVASSDVYRLDEDGDVATTYHYREGFDEREKTIGSVGKVVAGSDNAHWIVRFFGVFHTDYLILAVAPDYSWALVGQPDRKLGWVFARERTISDAEYRMLLEKFAEFGYDTSTFRRVAQVKEQAGQPGFQ